VGFASSAGADQGADDTAIALCKFAVVEDNKSRGSVSVVDAVMPSRTVVVDYHVQRLTEAPRPFKASCTFVFDQKQRVFRLVVPRESYLPECEFWRREVKVAAFAERSACEATAWKFTTGADLPAAHSDQADCNERKARHTFARSAAAHCERKESEIPVNRKTKAAKRYERLMMGTGLYPIRIEETRLKP
jgi:hypothetical protein